MEEGRRENTKFRFTDQIQFLDFPLMFDSLNCGTGNNLETEMLTHQVFQRRMDGSVNFYRPWDQYKTGFGTAAGEYWLGLENLFHLTLRKKYELLVDMEDFDGNKAFARYSSFSVNPEADGYRLNVSGFTDGGAGEFMHIYIIEEKQGSFDWWRG
uniref:Microfibril associated protein 4 n=1 Tax=Lates calcarifer TaxID=8187 RepID=A0A4W6G218_LATCA